jgi:hypothetical protein
MSDEPLDQVNRFVIGLVALLLLFGALAVILLAWGAPSGTIDRIDDFAGWLRDHEERDTKLIITLVAMVVALLAFSVIIVEMTPSPTQQMRVRNIKHGDGKISTTEMAQRAEMEATTVPHVAACQAIVAARGRRVEVSLELDVDAGADLAQTAEEACRRVHELIDQRMGIALARAPRARLHYRELKLRQDARTSGDMTMARRSTTGWERPDEGEHDTRGSTESPEEAQA